MKVYHLIHSEMCQHIGMNDLKKVKITTLMTNDFFFSLIYATL